MREGLAPIRSTTSGTSAVPSLAAKLTANSPARCRSAVICGRANWFLHFRAADEAPSLLDVLRGCAHHGQFRASPVWTGHRSLALHQFHAESRSVTMSEVRKPPIGTSRRRAARLFENECKPAA